MHNLLPLLGTLIKTVSVETQTLDLETEMQYKRRVNGSTLTLSEAHNYLDNIPDEILMIILKKLMNGLVEVEFKFLVQCSVVSKQFKTNIYDIIPTLPTAFCLGAWMRWTQSYGRCGPRIY